MPEMSKKKRKSSRRRTAKTAKSGESRPADELDGDAEDVTDDDELADDDESLVAELVPADEAEGAIDAGDGVLDAIAKKQGVSPRSTGSSLAKRDLLQAYIQETKQYPLLSREEEHELAVDYVETDNAASARRLIESNLRLVVKIAYEYRRAHRNLLDLIQEGNVGLMQAVRKYDPYRGVKLSTYAAWWIRAYILKFVLKNWRLVKIGTTQAQRKLFFNLRKEKERLEQLGFEPDTKLLAERLDVNEKDVIEMEKRLSAPDASLDAPVGSDDNDGSRTRLDMMEGEAAGRPDVAVENNEFHSLLREKLTAFGDTLKGREETIFRLRLLNDEPLTLQEIGDRYGVSRERARQLEKRLLGKLRKYLEDELGAAVDVGALTQD